MMMTNSKNEKAMQKCGIYVHIPFCVSKCTYCNFVSICAGTCEIDKYMEHLQKEIKLCAKHFDDRQISSIYIGGGTPSYIDAGYIARLLECLKDNYNVLKNAEISIECNPCSINEQKLKAYKMCGINRISFGIQSLNDANLKVIGRKHTANQAISAVRLAQKVGFKNISADLLIGVPNQTKADLIKDIQTLAQENVMHISAYMLMVEEGTPIFNQIRNRELCVASDDECVQMYDSAVLNLNNLGYKRYEISNFAKDGYMCSHNQNYWDMGEYIGFGLASHSFVSGHRISGVNDFQDYYNYVNALKGFDLKQISKFKAVEKLTRSEVIEEYIMLSLRCERGLSLSYLKNLGYDILEQKQNEISLLQKNNIIEINGDYLKIAQDYFGASNAVILKLIP